MGYGPSYRHFPPVGSSSSAGSTTVTSTRQTSKTAVSSGGRTPSGSQSLLPQTASSVSSSFSALSLEALPAGWEEKWDPKHGAFYYVDHVNQTNQWERPITPVLEPARVAPVPSPSDPILFSASKLALGSASTLPPGWEMMFSYEGAPYYVDHNTRTSTWDPPPSVPPSSEGAAIFSQSPIQTTARLPSTDSSDWLKSHPSNASPQPYNHPVDFAHQGALGWDSTPIMTALISPSTGAIALPECDLRHPVAESSKGLVEAGDPFNDLTTSPKNHAISTFSKPPVLEDVVASSAAQMERYHRLVSSLLPAAATASCTAEELITRADSAIELYKLDGDLLSFQKGSGYGAGDDDARWDKLVLGSTKEAMTGPEQEVQQIIFELVKTELQFVHDLTILQNLFIVPLQTSSPTPIILPDRLLNFLRAISPDALADLLRHHQLLLAGLLRLQQREHPRISIVALARVFLDDLGFEWEETYVEYAEAFPLASWRARHERLANPAFSRLVERFHANPFTRRLKLEHFLSRPLPRLPRYSLLLSSLLCLAPAQEPGSTEVLDAARARLDALGKRVDSSAGKAEDRVRKWKLDSSPGGAGLRARPDAGYGDALRKKSAETERALRAMGSVSDEVSLQALARESGGHNEGGCTDPRSEMLVESARSVLQMWDIAIGAISHRAATYRLVEESASTVDNLMHQFLKAASDGPSTETLELLLKKLQSCSKLLREVHQAVPTVSSKYAQPDDALYEIIAHAYDVTSFVGDNAALLPISQSGSEERGKRWLADRTKELDRIKEVRDRARGPVGGGGHGRFGSTSNSLSWANTSNDGFLSIGSSGGGGVVGAVYAGEDGDESRRSLSRRSSFADTLNVAVKKHSKRLSTDIRDVFRSPSRASSPVPGEHTSDHLATPVGHGSLSRKQSDASIRSNRSVLRRK